MWVPHKELKKKKKKISKTEKRMGVTEEGRQQEISFLFFFSLFVFLRFTKTCSSEFVGINTESALRDEGYA